MKYKEAMAQRCKCGEFAIGGWCGDEKTGKPNFARISCPYYVAPNIFLTEEHTLNGCWRPNRIA